MAYAEGSKILALKDVDNVRTLYEVTKNDLRKIPAVDELPSPSKSKRGLVYLYDDGEGEKQYVCVQTGADEYGWVAVGTPDAMEATVYDPSGAVENSGGIPRYVGNAVSDSERRIESYVDDSVSGKMNTTTYDGTGTVAASGGIPAYVANQINASVSQANYTQNSSSAKDYIQNRQFYDASSTSDSYNCSFVADPSKMYAMKFIADGDNCEFLAYLLNSSTINHFASSRSRMVIDGEYYDFPSPGVVDVTIGGRTYQGYLIFKPGVFAFFQRYQSGSYYYYIGIPHADSKQHVCMLYHYSGSLVQLPMKFIDLSSREKRANKVNTIAPNSTNDQYPSAKAVVSYINDTAELQSRKVTTISPSSTDYQYPSAKAVYDFVSQSGGGSSVRMGTINLGTSWGGNDPYTQSVTVTGTTITANSKVDLQPDSSVMEQLTTDGVTALWIENNNGVLTAYAIGGSPSVAMTVQCTVTEIS